MSMLLTLLSGTWTRLAGLLAAVAGVVAVLFAARKSGADAVKATVERQNAETAKRMAKAETDGARSKRDLLDRLRGSGPF